MSTNTPSPEPCTAADAARLERFVALVNDGILPSIAIEQTGFDPDAGELYPEHECLTFDDSDLIDFTPIATSASAIVVRRAGPGAAWTVEYRYSANTF